MKRLYSFVAVALVVGLMLSAFPVIVGAAEPIKPGVTITIATSSGLKKLKVGGLLPSEAKELLLKYTLKATPAALYLTERDYTHKIKTGDLGLKPNVTALVNEASKADTDTAVGGKYVTQSAEKKLEKRIAALAKKLLVKPSNHGVAGGGTVKNLGGRTLDEVKELKAIVKALNNYGSSKAKKPAVLEAAIDLSKPEMIGRDGKGKVLVVSQTQRIVYLFKANKLTNQYRICIGMPSYKTPTGVYRVAKKKRNPTWNNPHAPWSAGMAESISGAGGPLGKAALYLTKNGKDIGIRFHGTAKLYSIGKAQSHGCMRLANSDIVKLYSKVPIGTMVSVFK